jgi:hypothetical protein
MLKFSNQIAVKRRVGIWICYREPLAVRKGAEEFAEDGLGAAWLNFFRLCRVRPLQCFSIYVLSEV